MSADTDFEEAVSQLGGVAEYWVDRCFMYGLAVPGDRPPHQWARTVVSELTSSDEHEVAGAALTVAEWVDTDDPEWWESPLGRLVEATTPARQRLVGDDVDAEIGTRQAASLLDVSYSRIDQLVQEDRIRRFGRNRLSRADVGALLAERAADPDDFREDPPS